MTVLQQVVNSNVLLSLHSKQSKMLQTGSKESQNQRSCLIECKQSKGYRPVPVQYQCSRHTKQPRCRIKQGRWKRASYI